MCYFINLSVHLYVFCGIVFIITMAILVSQTKEDGDCGNEKMKKLQMPVFVTPA